MAHLGAGERRGEIHGRGGKPGPDGPRSQIPGQAGFVPLDPVLQLAKGKNNHHSAPGSQGRIISGPQDIPLPRENGCSSRESKGLTPRAALGSSVWPRALLYPWFCVLTASAWGVMGWDWGAQPNPAFALGSRLAPGAASALCSLTARSGVGQEHRQRLSGAWDHPAPTSCRWERQPLSQAPSREQILARSSDLPLSLQQCPGNSWRTPVKNHIFQAIVNAHFAAQQLCSKRCLFLPAPNPHRSHAIQIIWGMGYSERWENTKFPQCKAPLKPHSPVGRPEQRCPYLQGTDSYLQAQRKGRMPNAAGWLHMVGFTAASTG